MKYPRSHRVTGKLSFWLPELIKKKTLKTSGSVFSDHS